MRPPAAHRATTASLQALYPFVSGDPGAGPDPRSARRPPGTLVGRDLMGGPFRFDPWDLYAREVITNPNVVVLGQLGRGKSTFVKSLVWRQLAFGRQAWIIDPKGEYGPLVHRCGAEPVTLVPGGRLRVNPLDGGRPYPSTAGHDAVAGLADPDGRAGDSRARAGSDLVVSLLSSSLGRALRPEERTCVELAVATVVTGPGIPTLPAVVEALLRPDPVAVAAVGVPPETLQPAARLVALELRRMVHGDLAGMFDGPTSAAIDLSAPVVVLDLSATFASPALPLIMTCAAAWLQSAVSSATGVRRLVVVDEAWAILSDRATARWAQATFKLSRSLGVANVLVAHRISDLQATGDDGTTEQKLAGGLLADTETRVVFGQPATEARATAAALGLGTRAAETIAQLPRGIALWQVGRRCHLVEHLLGVAEAAMVDTDGAMQP
jgi:hypothetical protein